MTIAREEIFGPVLAAIEFADVDEAIARANDSTYGLAAAVWTKDIKKAHYVARKLQAGTVWINTYNIYDTAAPFGGYKQSGFGREMSMHALEHYTQVKSVWVDSESDEQRLRADIEELTVPADNRAGGNRSRGLAAAQSNSRERQARSSPLTVDPRDDVEPARVDVLAHQLRGR